MIGTIGAFQVLTAKRIMGVFILCFILNGTYTTPADIPGKVDKTELKYMAGVIDAENGNMSNDPDMYYNDVLRQLLTGSVVLNRMYSDKWNGNTIEEVVMAKDGGYIQYATKTRNTFKNRKPSELTKMIAKYLLLYGPICPPGVVFQGQGKHKTKLYMSIPVKGDKDELFYYGNY